MKMPPLFPFLRLTFGPSGVVMTRVLPTGCLLPEAARVPAGAAGVLGPLPGGGEKIRPNSPLRAGVAGPAVPRGPSGGKLQPNPLLRRFWAASRARSLGVAAGVPRRACSLGIALPRVSILTFPDIHTSCR